jgi:hypothetical protein
MVKVLGYWESGKDWKIHCNGCEAEIDRNDAARGDDSEYYCYDCVYIVKDDRQTICPACRNYSKHHTVLCKECHKQGHYRRAVRQWNGEINRTADQNTKDGITLLEWFDTLRHFEYRCIYCTAGYSDLDHYVPVFKGGRTVAGNCVPACKFCNSEKRAKHPRRYKPDFQGIERYLKTQKARHAIDKGIEKMINRAMTIKTWIFYEDLRERGMPTYLDDWQNES